MPSFSRRTLGTASHQRFANAEKILAIQARTTVSLRSKPTLLPSQKFCVISARQAEYLSADNLPDCRTHLHMSAKDAKVWLKSEYGPGKMVPCKFKHSGQTEPTFRREVATQGSVISLGRRNFLIIEYATSPQTGMCGGLVMVTWKRGLPPEKPKRGKQISNGHPQRIITASGIEHELSLAAHRCQEL